MSATNSASVWLRMEDGGPMRFYARSGHRFYIDGQEVEPFDLPKLYDDALESKAGANYPTLTKARRAHWSELERKKK